MAKDKALTTKGSDLNRLHRDDLHLMIVLSQKYLSLRSRKANDYLDADPLMDDRTMLSEDIVGGKRSGQSRCSFRPLTHASVDRAFQAESVGSNSLVTILIAIRRSPNL